MNVLYNRRLACAALAVCVLLSVFGLGGAELARTRKNALRVFDEGIDTSFAVRMSVDAYLENCAGYARTMAEELKLHTDDESDAAEALALADSIGDGANLRARHENFEALNDVVESMYTAYHAAEPDADRQRDFDRAYTNYQSEVAKIGYDEYNPMARKYNVLSGDFPARMIAGLFGLDRLETF